MGAKVEHTWFKWREDALEVLDQRYLPFKEKWHTLRTERQVAWAIKNMVLRGAPAIGIAAAFGFVLGVRRKVRLDKIKQILLNTRPTAVNLANAISRMEKAWRMRRDIEEEAISIWSEDFKACEMMGKHGAELIPPNSKVLTICNTGSLATGGWGTAFSALKVAYDQGKKIHVIACETRPFLQGARLTVWELKKFGIPFTLICDSAAAFLISKGEIACVFTGADRITGRGFVANKVGTLSLACACQIFKVPFYVVAPTTTIDVKEEIPIEERDGEEVRMISGKRIVAKDTPVRNPAFDITPPHLITYIITEKGISKPSEI